MRARTSVLCHAVALFVLASLVSAESVVTIVLPEADAYVYAALPLSEFGDDHQLISRGGEQTMRSYLTFDIGGAVPAGRVFQSATLWLYVVAYDASPDPVPVNAHEVLTAWTESTMNWNNQPGYEAAVVDTANIPNDEYIWYSWDLTSIWPDTGSKLRTALETSASYQRNFASREWGGVTYDPYLEVTHTPEPGTLVVLALGLGGLLLRRRRA